MATLGNQNTNIQEQDLLDVYHFPTMVELKNLSTEPP